MIRVSHRGSGSRGTCLLLESVVVGLSLLTLTAWFAGWPPGLPAWLPAGVALVAVAARLWLGRLTLSRPAPETLLCLAVALAFRLPVLQHPWGWVNKDGFYGAMVALHVLQGIRPAPAFLEGVNYQGTLKAHLAALLSLLTGSQDLAWVMAASSAVLSLVFILATMTLARRLAGRGAALVAGLYLALGPKFLTTITMDCQGHYVEILALGGLALAWLARLLDEGVTGSRARIPYFGVGLLLGAALWQQPVAACYVAAALLALGLRRTTWTDPWALLVPLGLVVGLWPVLLWNALNDWGSREILARSTTTWPEVLGGLPRHAWRTLSISFPVLAGLSPGHPLRKLPGMTAAAACLPILLLVAHLGLRGRGLWGSLARWRPQAALLPPLLMAASLGIFWAVPADLVHLRPRYVLPVAAATAVHLGVVGAWAWSRWRLLSCLGLGLLLSLNVSGMLPRLWAGREIAERYRRLVHTLDQKGIRTGYADFSIAAPVTMFTAERIVISPRLGPTPNYESKVHARMVDERGADAYVLDPSDDPERFAALLRSLGVQFRLDEEPVTIFYGFSRRVRFEEVAGFRDFGDPPVARRRGLRRRAQEAAE